jgi:hypothetical protein
MKKKRPGLIPGSPPRHSVLPYPPPPWARLPWPPTPPARPSPGGTHRRILHGAGLVRGAASLYEQVVDPRIYPWPPTPPALTKRQVAVDAEAENVSQPNWQIHQLASKSLMCMGSAWHEFSPISMSMKNSVFFRRWDGAVRCSFLWICVYVRTDYNKLFCSLNCVYIE